jgi:hypothetical protein
MGRGSIYNAPWIRGVNIPWVGSLIYHGQKIQQNKYYEIVNEDIKI